jgi:HAD superfamily hydrolase (TIGR01458 family)
MYLRPWKTQNMTALLIDLDGVLYEADVPVPGAAAAIQWLRDNGVPHLFLTNTTSRPRSAIVEKLARLGIDAVEGNILTPPVAAVRWLAANAAGPAALFVAPATVEEFTSLEIAAADQQSVASVVIGDYGERWSFTELNRAFRLLMNEPRPALVALGMTRYWQAEDGLRLDTAPFVMALAHASGVDPVVLGKPARPFFETAMTMLGTSPAETLMVGDDIQGDIGGAQAAGIAGALVRTGKFRPQDLEGDIGPEFVLDSFADLPACWAEIVSTRN